MNEQRNVFAGPGKVIYRNFGVLIFTAVLFLPAGAHAATDTLYPAADTYIIKKNPNTAYGTDDRVVAKNQYGNTRYGYIRFDTGSVPAEAEIAEVRLTGTLGDPWDDAGEGAIHTFADCAWDESMTWDTRPSESALGAVLLSIPLPAAEGTPFDIDVTDYVNAERDAGRDEVCFAARVPDVGPGGFKIYSRESGTPPALIIETADPVNQAPVVNAGVDETITLPEKSVQLTGSVSDDGLPNPPATLALAWTVIAGPGTAIFSDSSSAATNVTLSLPGDYLFRLTADDGELSTSADVTITLVYPDLPPEVHILNPAADTFIKKKAGDTSYGTDNWMAAKNQWGNTRYGYIKFDTSALAPGTEITDVRLAGTLGSPWDPAGEGALHTFGDCTWGESMTWNTQPSESALGALLTTIPLPVNDGDLLEVDVTDYVNGERDAGRNVVCFALRVPEAGDAGFSIYSRESSTPPALILETPAPPPAPPVIQFTSPAPNALVNQPQTLIYGTVDDVPFTMLADLTEGENVVTKTVVDVYGFEWTADLPLTLDTTPPDIAVVSPPLNAWMQNSNVSVECTVDGAPDVENVALPQQGPNTISIVRTDAAGNTGVVTHALRLDSIPPVIEFTSHGEGEVVTGTEETISYTIDGAAHSGVMTLAGEGPNTYSVAADDAAGNHSEKTLTLVRDTSAPAFTVHFPQAGTYVNRSEVVL